MLEKHPVGHQSAAAPSGNVSSAWAMAGVMTWLLVKVLTMVVAPRVDEEAERMGLDLHQHGEKGYTG